ncbi:hypothetical protein BJP34_12110 [Moorena producens PAL-8-15-08-1]|uniref:Uncharacterized protein n=1 Tax=Moorena producens PAL-8-15-08-1 TaxID=1458985 RepID=A0A1D8TR21_9CYAN|nr:hypothetical protein [Moorena producens]AOX00089.1 hypothetical protein BJP34_12110 [Moorena producens PAL-8-15-08-1]
MKWSEKPISSIFDGPGKRGCIEIGIFEAQNPSSKAFRNKIEMLNSLATSINSGSAISVTSIFS